MQVPDYLEIRSSSIHNKGVFALKPIKKGQKVIEYVGERITKAESARRADKTLEKANADSSHGAVYIFEINKRYDIDGDVEWNPARFINHSCDPNCEAENIKGRIWITALRDIQPQEELFYNYGYDMDNLEDHPCRCGSPKCIGYIVAQEHFPKVRQRKAQGTLN